MEFEKLQSIIAEVLNVDADEITPETTFVDDLGADSLDDFRSYWNLRKNLISRFRRKRRKRSYPSVMRQRRSKLQLAEKRRRGAET